MDDRTLLRIERAFFEGAYSIAFDLSSETVKSQSRDNSEFLYRAMSEIGMSDFKTLSIDSIAANLCFAFEELCKDCETVEEAEKKFNNALMMCSSINDTLREKFEILDEELKCQYQGGTGISFDSDDPAEKEKRDRERAFNNNINVKRNILKEKYENIVSCLFEVTITSIYKTDIFKNSMSEISLEFIEFVGGFTHQVSKTTSKAINEFFSAVKRQRNEKYWSQNADLYKILITERAQYEKKIEQTLKYNIARSEQEIEKAEKDKEAAKKERKRYSIFNFKDRKPHNKIIDKSREIIKVNKKLIENYHAGVCEECEHEQKRIKEINIHLTTQR